ncbi:hypothetical protein MTR67_038351 [Solanum verrucosum]|uniref:Uncharacterized protein n=1 Tax=Solanum verrucosum TaxID=315347 RepID=A0AAF0UGC5_SOLVR|nr:hypothetical protein MTR67_038351 [Solanum verrucosum]
MEEPIPIYGRQINSHKVSNGCPPTYMMSLFPIPGIEKKINKLRRVFLWQGNKEKLGYNLVKWDEELENLIPRSIYSKSTTDGYSGTGYGGGGSKSSGLHRTIVKFFFGFLVIRMPSGL